MIETIVEAFSNFRVRDVIDICIVAFLIYSVLLLIKGTRSVQMLVGIMIILLGFFVSQYLELYTLHWVFSYFLGALVIGIIVIFQNDIRKALSEMGKNPFFTSNTFLSASKVSDEIVKASKQLTNRRIGALIVLERENGLNDYMEAGTRIGAEVTAELIISIFIPASPIHDGALIIQDGKIAAAGCFLPLSDDTSISKALGTRHRAALGISEHTDAITVMISEETGKVSLAVEGKLIRDLDMPFLRNKLNDLFKAH